MISFNQLGNLGRLGNQMFQYASLRGIAANRGFDFCIPPKSQFGTTDPNVKNSTENIHNTFNLVCKNFQTTENKLVEEKEYHFDKNLFDTCEDNIDLSGYFQTEKYFKHIEDDIRKEFTFSKDIVDSCSQFIKEIDSNREVISLHVRRSDYLHLQSFHPIPSIQYYIEALKQLPDVPVFIFSDDTNWCSMRHEFDSDRFLISESNSADFDMCLMSMCKYHIIANSSFSWWGAWLSNSKEVIAPKVWFGSSLSDKKTDDLYCSGWKTL